MAPGYSTLNLRAIPAPCKTGKHCQPILQIVWTDPLRLSNLVLVKFYKYAIYFLLRHVLKDSINCVLQDNESVVQIQAS